MFRSTLRHTQPNCKVDFAKFTKFAFFLLKYLQKTKKNSTFAQKFKNGTKLQ